MSNRDRMTAQIAELLEASGLSPAEARARAAEGVAGLEMCAPGTGLGHIYPEQIATIWQQAARAGRRRLVLEVTAEAQDLDDDTGRVNVRVLEAENWPQWTDEHTAQRATTDALLRPAPAPAGWDVLDTSTDQPAEARAEWSESDYMVRGLDAPDVYKPDDQAADAPARAEKELN